MIEASTSPASTSALALETSSLAAELHEVDPIGDPRWTELVSSHARASVFHSTSWLKALRIVYGYDPVVITTTPPGAALTNGVVVCRIRSWLTGSRLVSLPFSDHCEPLISCSEEFDELLMSMRRYADEGKWKYVEIRPVSIEPSARTKFGKHLTYCFHRLDLTQSTDELFRHFHKDCVQRKIRRAEREKLKYEEGTSEALLQKFYRLLVMTRQRKSLPPQPLAWFRGLVTAFGKDLKIRVASHNDLPVASILTLSYKKTMTYKYGCSDSAFNKLGGMALLFWKTIQEAKDEGYEELDLGRSDADNLGLIAFKDHWGAASTSLTYWKYPIDHAAARSWVWQNKVIRRATSAAPKFMLQTLGRLLYRHIG